MQSAAVKQIVLIGGGHAHIIVLKAFGIRPEPGVALTLVTREVAAPYSGMLPGFVAGHYTYAQCHIDTRRLAAWAGARLVHGTVTRIDRARRRVEIEGRPPLAYDLVSIDVGITPSLDGIDGAAEHAIAVKPVSTFATRWNELERAALMLNGPRRIVVVGSGAAGFELVLAVRHKLRTSAPAAGIAPDVFSFALVGGEALLPSHCRRARALARKELARQGVTLVEDDRAVRIAPAAVELASGRTIAADATLLATHGAPATWFAVSGLPRDSAGFVAVRPTLQLLDDDDAFAVGDCATVLAHPREKAGVFAVRQGVPLAANLRLRARGMAAKPFTPQRAFLSLLSTGGKHAIASRNGYACAGNLLWRWKDRIDRAFMSGFDVPDIAAGERIQRGDAVEMTDASRSLLDLILSRRSVSPRHLVEPAPSPEQLDLILRAAAAAPDHKKLRPFRFILVPPGRRAALAAAFRDAKAEQDPGAPAEEVAQAGEKAYRGAMLLAVVLRIERDHPRVSISDQMLAAGAAVENMLLAANALGFGGSLRSGISATSRRVRIALGVSGEEELAAFLVLGTPARTSPQRSDDVSGLLSIWE